MSTHLEKPELSLFGPIDDSLPSVSLPVSPAHHHHTGTFPSLHIKQDDHHDLLNPLKTTEHTNWLDMDTNNTFMDDASKHPLFLNASPLPSPPSSLFNDLLSPLGNISHPLQSSQQHPLKSSQPMAFNFNPQHTSTSTPSHPFSPSSHDLPIPSPLGFPLSPHYDTDIRRDGFLMSRPYELLSPLNNNISLPLPTTITITPISQNQNGTTTPPQISPTPHHIPQSPHHASPSTGKAKKTSMIRRKRSDSVSNHLKKTSSAYELNRQLVGEHSTTLSPDVKVSPQRTRRTNNNNSKNTLSPVPMTRQSSHSVTTSYDPNMDGDASDAERRAMFARRSKSMDELAYRLHDGSLPPPHHPSPRPHIATAIEGPTVAVVMAQAVGDITPTRASYAHPVMARSVVLPNVPENAQLHSHPLGPNKPPSKQQPQHTGGKTKPPIPFIPPSNTWNQHDIPPPEQPMMIRRGSMDMTPRKLQPSMAEQRRNSSVDLSSMQRFHHHLSNMISCPYNGCNVTCHTHQEMEQHFRCHQEEGGAIRSPSTDNLSAGLQQMQLRSPIPAQQQPQHQQPSQFQLNGSRPPPPQQQQSPSHVTALMEAQALLQSNILTPQEQHTLLLQLQALHRTAQASAGTQGGPTPALTQHIHALQQLLITMKKSKE